MSKIKVIGVGGCGINVIRRLRERRLPAVERIAIDADEDCLNASQADRTVKIEKRMFYKADVEEGRRRTLRDSFVESIQNALDGAEFVFITGNLGGRTGAAVMPVVAAGARWRNACGIALAYMPFTFEGRARRSQADEALARLRTAAHACMLIENDAALRAVRGSVQMSDAYRMMDGNFAELIRITAALASEASPAEVAKLRDLLQCDAGLYIGTASGRPAIACDCGEAFGNPWMKFDPVRMQGALAFMEAGTDVPQGTLDAFADQIHRKTAARQRPWIEIRRSDALGDAVRITLVAAQEDGQAGGCR